MIGWTIAELALNNHALLLWINKCIYFYTRLQSCALTDIFFKGILSTKKRENFLDFYKFFCRKCCIIITFVLMYDWFVCSCLYMYIYYIRLYFTVFLMARSNTRDIPFSNILISKKQFLCNNKSYCTRGKSRVQYVFFIAQKLLFANQYVRKWNVTYIASGQ